MALANWQRTGTQGGNVGRRAISVSPRVRLALLLGALTTIGPIGIDMYLPAFPALLAAFDAAPGTLELSLVAYVVALSAGQAVWGPLADRFGRRPPLLVGLLLAMTAALLVTVAGSGAALVGLRFFQGLGACAAVVIARSIARDSGSGHEVARLIAMMAIVQAVSPAFGPSLGGLLLALEGWRVVFFVMAGMAGMGLLVTVFLIEESLPPARRPATVGAAFARYRELGADRAFVLTVLTGGCGSGMFFSFLTGSPQVLMGQGGLSPSLFAAYFSTNAILMVAMAQIGARLVRVMPAQRMLLVATALSSSVALVHAALIAAGAAPLGLSLVLLPVTLSFGAVIHPIIAMRALEFYPHAAGAASAVLGIVQYACGAVAGTIVSALAGGGALAMTTTMAAAALLAHVLTRLTRPREASVSSDQ